MKTTNRNPTQMDSLAGVHEDPYYSEVSPNAPAPDPKNHNIIKSQSHNVIKTSGVKKRKGYYLSDDTIEDLKFIKYQLGHSFSAVLEAGVALYLKKHRIGRDRS